MFLYVVPNMFYICIKRVLSNVEFPLVNGSVWMSDVE